MSEARVFEPAAGRTRTVTVIPARIRALPGMPTLAVQKKRVAAYARVSTNSEEQLTSYEAQVKHYTEYIQSKNTPTIGSLFLSIRIRGLPEPAQPSAKASTI